MSKHYRFRVFLSSKKDIAEVAYGLTSGTSVTYSNLKLLPKIAETLTDGDLETLVKEVMQILDIGAIESALLRKRNYISHKRNTEAVEQFKNLDMSHLLVSGNTK